MKHTWFIYNALHLAAVSLVRGNLYAADNFLRDARHELGA